MTKAADNQVTHPAGAEIHGKPVRFRPGLHNYTMTIGLVVCKKPVGNFAANCGMCGYTVFIILNEANRMP